VRADDVMTEAEAEQYHAPQIAALAEAGADLVDALTLTNPPEALGIARAAGQAGIPAVISFTVETDGSLPNGMRLRDAIEEVEAGAGRSVAYFMVNCAHPTHFAGVLEDGGAWLERIRGVRANASAKSHAELDEAEELDEGDPVELAEQYLELGKLLPNLTVVGGCCGTDHRHVGAICSAWSERGVSTA
jgi:S-methylmethionine-dependent homocysteine/selenocysteine methylase